MVAADYQRIILKTGGINDELSKIRNVDAGRDLPGVRIPDQPCQEKENDEEKHLSPYKEIKNGII